MKKNIELYTGIFVVTGCICIGFLVLVLGGFKVLPSDQYSLYGYFFLSQRLEKGARVEIAGVQIGNVSQIQIDKERMVARVDFHIKKSIEISEDSIASVKTSGIIGEKFIAISPGGTDLMLEDGDEIYNTESSLDIEGLVRKLIFSDSTP